MGGEEDDGSGTLALVLCELRLWCCGGFFCTRVVSFDVRVGIADKSHSPVNATERRVMMEVSKFASVSPDPIVVCCTGHEQDTCANLLTLDKGRSSAL